MVFSTRKRTVAWSVVAGVLMGCGSDPVTPPPPPPPPPAPSVQVTPAAATLATIGDTVRFAAVYKDAQGNTVPGKSFTWASSNVAISTVDASGLVTVVSGDGQATISATADGVSGSATLIATITVASVELTPAIGEIIVLGGTLQFDAVAKDAGGSTLSGKTFTWASSDLTIASVAATGLTTSAGIGTTTITAATAGVQGAASLTVSQAGTGTGTLTVIANVNANDVGGGLFTTSFDVTLTDAALAPVSGATVTITNAVLGPVGLAETGPGTGIYTALRPQFPGGEFELDVISGADSVLDVIVRGPGVHVLMQPQLSDIVVAGQPLTVLWTVPRQAKGAEIETRDYAPVMVFLDNGVFVIAGADNPANASQRIRLWRFNQVDIVGGLAGSRLQIKIRAELEPVVVAASLTFSGDATYQGPHASQPIKVAVVEVGTGVVALDSGIVSGTADPSFSFSFPGVLVEGESYEVHYWIDSNFGGGTVGVCDPTANDHQWRVVVPPLTGADVAITEIHNAATVTDVCASFP